MCLGCAEMLARADICNCVYQTWISVRHDVFGKGGMQCQTATALYASQIDMWPKCRQSVVQIIRTTHLHKRSDCCIESGSRHRKISVTRKVVWSWPLAACTEHEESTTELINLLLKGKLWIIKLWATGLQTVELCTVTLCAD